MKQNVSVVKSKRRDLLSDK